MRQLIKPLGIGLTLITVLCISFYFFYKSFQKDPPKQDLILTSAVLNQPLPKSHLVNISGKRLEDERLRSGKVVLVFMMPDCPACDRENEFLKKVATSRKDVNFIYVLPFGNKNVVLKSAETKYDFEPFFDEGSNMSKTLDLYQVPIKVFLEDGIIKRTWLDATVDSRKQADFTDWLKGV
jgi:hypothetical protein